MKFAARYLSWSNEKKNLFILGCIALAGLLVFVCGFFINNPGLFFGWALGSVIEMICYCTIFLGARFLLDPNDKDGKKGYLGALFAIGRLLLYGGGLVLGAFCTYKWGTVSHGYCNLWTVFAGYMPMIFVLIVTTLTRNKHASAPKQEGEKKQ